MDRRGFLGNALGANLFLAGVGAADKQPAAVSGSIMVERAAAGRPHAGKVLAAIQPHADDIPLFAAGTVAKLVVEGYTGYLIRVTNDDMTGPGSIGNGVAANEKDNRAVGRALGCRQVFDLNYNNHRMDEVSIGELRVAHGALGGDVEARLLHPGRRIELVRGEIPGVRDEAGEGQVRGRVPFGIRRCRARRSRRIAWDRRREAAPA